jgi:hypothetical protein
MTAQRRFRIPDTRLPFINAEIAEVNFGGEPHLVSSTYGGKAGGRLCFWNPDTGSVVQRRLPHGVRGTYMLKAGPDGALYLGCAGGDLLRYDPTGDSFETLVGGELSGLCWGGIVAPPYVMWNASREGVAAVALYDMERGQLAHVFAPVDDGDPRALFCHRAAVAPDGRIVWGLNVPQARLALMDPAGRTVAVSTPEWLKGSSWVYPLFLDDGRLAVFSGSLGGREQLRIVSYPDFEDVETCELPMAPGLVHRIVVLVDGFLYRLGNMGGDLYRLRLATLTWECVCENWTQGEWATLGLWRGRDVAAVTVGGEAFCYRTATARTDHLDLKVTGPLPAHALCAVPEAGLILGAPFINQRFWRIDMENGAGRDVGRGAPSGGQVNQIVWDARAGRAFLNSYTTTSVTVYDPAVTGAWPVNPKLVASAHHENQMRPMAMVNDGRFLWMATSPEYGQLGGALCRINMASGAIDVWRNIVPDQKPNSLALAPGRRLVYFATEIYADCDSCPPTQTTARVVAFDAETLQVRAERIVEKNSPKESVCGALPDGRALVSHGDRLFTWEPEGDDLRAWAILPAGMSGFVVLPNGTVVATDMNGLGVFVKEDATGLMRFEARLALPGATNLHLAAGNLYAATGAEIVEIPLADIGLG